MAIWALLIDRVVWPLLSMRADGANEEMLIAVINGMVSSLPDDLGVYLVRYAGLYVMIAVFVSLRRRVHALWGVKGNAKPAPA